MWCYTVYGPSPAVWSYSISLQAWGLILGGWTWHTHERTWRSLSSLSGWLLWQNASAQWINHKINVILLQGKYRASFLTSHSQHFYSSATLTCCNSFMKTKGFNCKTTTSLKTCRIYSVLSSQRSLYLAFLIYFSFTPSYQAKFNI